MVKDGNHHHHNDPHGKEGNAFELLPDRRLPCIAPPRASTRKLEVAKNETADEWWVMTGSIKMVWWWPFRFIWDGWWWSVLLLPRWIGDVFNKIDPDIDMWQQRWFCQSFDKWTIVPQRKIAPDKELHLCRTIRPTVGTLRPHFCPQCLQLCIFSMWNKIKTTWVPKDKPVSAWFLYSRLDPVGSVQWFITMMKLWTGSV